ncbi:hypothetical protein PGB90_009224 [Kerria lacca]
MCSGFLKNMGSKAGSSKEQKLQQKQKFRRLNLTEANLPIDEMIDIKNTVLAFKKSLQDFGRIVFNASSCNYPEAIKRIHAGLGEVLDNLKMIIDKYPIISTPEVYCSIHMLVSYIQFEFFPAYRDAVVSVVETDRLINQLALYFSRSVSQYIVQLSESSTKQIKSSDKVQGSKESKNSSAIFGIELEKHLNANKVEIPFVVSKCINEIETHGLYVNGIYRVSAVKSKVNQLCEAFEKYGNKVSLNDINPNIIANVLKLYLRELPQPLFTFELYPEFIRLNH